MQHDAPFNKKGEDLTDPLTKIIDVSREQDPMALQKYIIGCRKIDRRERVRPQILKNSYTTFLKKKKDNRKDIKDALKIIE